MRPSPPPRQHPYPTDTQPPALTRRQHSQAQAPAACAAALAAQVVFNRDSSNVGPREWVRLAKALHAARDAFDAFLIVHGTDTMAYTASALSLMLVGFRKPVVMTGAWAVGQAGGFAWGGA